MLKQVPKICHQCHHHVIIHAIPLCFGVACFLPFLPATWVSPVDQEAPFAVRSTPRPPGDLRRMSRAKAPGPSGARGRGVPVRQDAGGRKISQTPRRSCGEYIHHTSLVRIWKTQTSSYFPCVLSSGKALAMIAKNGGRSQKKPWFHYWRGVSVAMRELRSCEARGVVGSPP